MKNITKETCLRLVMSAVSAKPTPEQRVVALANLAADLLLSQITLHSLATYMLESRELFFSGRIMDESAMLKNLGERSIRAEIIPVIRKVEIKVLHRPQGLNLFDVMVWARPKPGPTVIVEEKKDDSDAKQN